jgi:hypothetical protein
MSQDNKPYTKLDANHTHTRSFDEGLDAHRVVTVAGTLPFSYDYVSLVLSVGNTRETYTFRDGGATGTIVGTVVTDYVDSTRNVMLNTSITRL